LERIFYVETEGVFHEPWQPTRDFGATCRLFRDRLFKLSYRTARLEYGEFLQEYSGRKRELNEQAIESLLTGGFKRHFSFVNTFVKPEWINKPADKAPRCIQPRDRRFNCWIGRYIKPIERQVYKALNEMYGGVVVAKGLNAQQRGVALREHWDALRNPVAVVLDVSRFDQHVSKEALEFEHSIYEWFFPASKEFHRKLAMMRNNIGFARCRDGSVKYNVEGRRMSGDMSTALGNVILMVAVLVSFMERYSEDLWRIFDDGDDCVLLVERDLVNSIKASIQSWFKSLGFKLKIEQVTDVFERVSFCQSSPIYDGTQWVMCRDPRMVLEKDLCQVKMFRTEREWQEKCIAISGCGLALAGNLPIFWRFYAMLGKFGSEKSGELHTGMDYLAAGLSTKCVEPTDATRLSFYRAFDITPHEQKLIESYWDTIQPEWATPGPEGLLVEDPISIFITRS